MCYCVLQWEEWGEDGSGGFPMAPALLGGGVIRLGGGSCCRIIAL